MTWNWRKEHLDLILVPIGLLIMFSYHLFLLYRVLKRPETTVIGFENHNRKAWVERLMQTDYKERSIGLTVINSHISAATTLISVSLVLSSLLGAWIGRSTENILTSSLVYGDTSPSAISIKYIALLSCFLMAFAFFIQTTRYFVNANFLISMPNCIVPQGQVEKALIRGCNFWSLGLRAFYFATMFLFWIFGPIPMFICSVVMVAALHGLDRNSTELHQFQPYPSNDYVKKNGNGNETYAVAMHM